MAVESDKDRLIFLDADEFGVEASYCPRDRGAAPVTIVGIFDAAHSAWSPNRWPSAEYQMQSGASFSSQAPMFSCRTADLPRGGRQNDRVMVSGAVYRVHDVQHDGTGMTRLILMEDDE